MLPINDIYQNLVIGDKYMKSDRVIRILLGIAYRSYTL